MYFNDYIDKEIPTWINELDNEYVQKVKDAFMECYNREEEIKLFEKAIQKTPERAEFYKTKIDEHIKNLKIKREKLRIVTEEAKSKLAKPRGLYTQAYENAQEALEKFKLNKQYLEDMRQNEIQDNPKRKF